MNQETALREEAHRLAEQLFHDMPEQGASFTDRLLDSYYRAQGKDCLLIYNPGGWGSVGSDHYLQWEKSLIAGIKNGVESLGYIPLLVHYVRTGKGGREKMRETSAQLHFFAFKARVLAAELGFLTRHIANLKVIMMGISQGAAFGNAVMQCSTELGQVYSIELGMPYFHISRRVITERTLAIDSNGLRPDAMVQGNLLGGIKAYLIGPITWLRHKLLGKPVRFAQCISAPGHDYDWNHTAVRQQITDFLAANFATGAKKQSEPGIYCEAEEIR